VTEQRPGKEGGWLIRLILTVGIGAASAPGGFSAAQTFDLGGKAVLLQRDWPDLTLKIYSNGPARSWTGVATSVDGRQVDFDVAMAISRPTEVYRLRGNRVLIRSDDGQIGSEFSLVNLSSREETEHIYAKRATVSPDNLHLVFERPLKRPEEDHVGSVILWYDLAASAEGGRSRREHDFLNVGVPVYPNYFRESGQFTVALEVGRLPGRVLSDRPVWLTDSTMAFGFADHGQAALVILDFGAPTQLPQLIERPLDAVRLIKSPHVPAVDLLRIEEIKVIEWDGKRPRVLRLRLGPVNDVLVRWLDVDIS
jgi:hypothetical protein